MDLPRLPSYRDRRAHGKSLREGVPPVDQAAWSRQADRDAVAAIVRCKAGRLPKMLPLKMRRMAASPFAFFRGSAPLMAADLARTAVTGLRVQLCGDAHVRNLGAYAAPDGHLVFDLNDFDETIAGPWEWDLKRLATSLVLAGHEAGGKDGPTAVRAMMRCYRESLARFSEMKVLELARYEIRRHCRSGPVRDILARAERLTPVKTLRKLTELGKDGGPRFHDQPPVLRHVPDQAARAVLAALGTYRQTISAGRQLILDAYHPVDVAFKVVGTGSIGTRNYVVLLFGNGRDDPLFLQVKEELPSCYRAHLPKAPACPHQGQRVAQGQQRMQTVTDPFLGWTTIGTKQYLVRQLADHKAAVNPTALKGEALAEYALVCGETLAKAHARTGDAAALAGYCGSSLKLDKAMEKFARSYAEQTYQDYEAFLKAIQSGRIKAADPA